jgi:hypothetical protein
MRKRGDMAAWNGSSSLRLREVGVEVSGYSLDLHIEIVITNLVYSIGDMASRME